MTDGPKQACVNCHFLVKNCNPNTLEVSAEQREKIRHQNYEWLADHYSLACYRGIWDEGFKPVKNRHEVIVLANREGACFFWEYQSGMLLHAAKELQQREARFQNNEVLQDSPWEPPYIKVSKMQSNPQKFNLKNIRALLIEGFTDVELRRLCYDELDFRPVYEQLAQEMGKDKVIDKLIEYAERKELIETLLALAKERNLAKYEKHQPYYEVITSPTRSSGTHGKSQRAKSPKVFISYSWDDDDHKAWVADLATRLRNDGIETILDQWHAVPGDQLPQFMEREIRDNEYVLIICTPNYRKKSDERKGGVGYEGDIMTTKVHTQRNHRKFIPILAQGPWGEAAPSWLKGKYYIDLTSSGAFDRNYSDLTATLLGKRVTAPPVRQSSPSTTQNPPHVQFPPDEPIKIVGVIIDEVTEPTMDGTRGSALSRVPFRLSRQPSRLWAELFVKTWDSPPQSTAMHRPGIASASGAKIILDGTTIEEVKEYHRDTLVLCINQVNEEEAGILEQKRQEDVRHQQQSENHRRNVDEISRGLSFD